MGNVVDPIYYFDGNLDDTIQAITINVARPKTKEDTITADGYSKHTSYDNVAVTGEITVLPTVGNDNNKWLRYALDTSKHSILEDLGEGEQNLITEVEITGVDKSSGRGGAGGGKTWRVPYVGLRSIGLNRS